jgi:anthranilate phosphoribosyltransferase
MANDVPSFKTLLNKLVKTPEYFTPADLKLALNQLFTESVDPTQIGAFLTALHINRVERRPESLAAAAQVLRERALKAVVEDRDQDFVVDIVGTGGDGYNTFNVSTTAAIVAAGAGARVIKVSGQTIFSLPLFTQKKPAWQPCIDLVLRIRRSPPITRLSLHRPEPRNTHAHP